MDEKKTRTSNLKPFKKGMSGNPKGRPRKSIESVLKELKEYKVKPVTLDEVKAVYMSLVALSETELTKMIGDKDAPMLFRVVAKRILSKDGFEVIEKLINRAYGRPKEEVSSEDKAFEVIIKREDGIN